MKLNNLALNHLAKTVVLGLAVLLASSAFASNKGTLQAHETLVVNGQQLATGEYQLRWDGAGSTLQRQSNNYRSTLRRQEIRSSPRRDRESRDERRV